MQLNLPILDQLSDSKNILIAGAGGGFDVFCGLPVYFTLQSMGKNVHLGNYSFSYQLGNPAYFMPEAQILVEDGLIGARGDIPIPCPYLPEGYLSQWFKETLDQDVPIWMLKKVGPRALLPLYQHLIDHLEIDAIVLLDGGVDSVMTGDEDGAGTLLEDTISLMTVAQLEIPVKILGCLGFGAELEVAHNNALYNMAELSNMGAFLGACALTKAMPVYQQYEAASRYVWEQPMHHKSQINMRVVSAVLGEFGDFHLYHDYRPLPVFVSPLMSLYWFYDSDTVASRSVIADQIRHAETIEEALRATVQYRSLLDLRKQHSIPY